MSPPLRLFGPPGLRAGGAVVRLGPERRFQLLVLLALHDGAWVERERIAGLFWPGHDAAAARRNLRKVIFDARAVPGADAVEASEHAVRWAVDSDLRAFRRAVREQRPEEAADSAADDAWPGIEDGANAALAGWFAAERAAVLLAWQASAHECLRAPLAPARREALAQRLLAQDPLDETAVAAQLDAALARGETTAAHRLYQAYAQRLQDELAIAPSNALRDRLARPPAPPPQQPLIAPAAPTAPAASAFVGRGTELAELGALLAREDCRLVTVLGAGGVGKSRLAQQALARLAARFPGGRWWTELLDLADSAAVTARVAAQVGAEINDTRDTLAQLAAALPQAPALLVLDNAEHLPDLPAWVGRLRAAAPALTLLVTSRQRLHVEGEWLLPLGGLALPDEESRDLEAARHFDALRLFELRAAAARPGFELGAHLPAVLDIVDAVGGLPLAIELAASWVRLLPAAAIASDLRGSTDLLQRDLPHATPGARPDHDSLAAVLEGSWSHLAPRERDALAAVTVFAGGFTRAAAQAVAGVGLPLLAALADRSLLQVDESGRFSLHPLTAAFAAGKLAADAERQAALSLAHVRHHAGWLHTLAPLARGNPRELIVQMHPEQANWTLAWQRALQAREYDALVRMLPALLGFFETQGRWNEGVALLRTALAQASGHAPGRPARARLGAAQATLLYRRGDLRDAESTAAEAVRLAREIGDSYAEIAALVCMGLSMWNQGRGEEVPTVAETLLEVARREGDTNAVARGLTLLALADKASGRYASALARQLEVLAIHRTLGNPAGIAAALNNIGNLHRAEGRFRDALPYFEEGLQFCSAQKLEVARQFHALNLGLCLYELGDAERRRAAALFLQTLTDVRRAGQPQLELATLMALARCESAAGQFASAVARLREALDLSATKGFVAGTLDVLGVYAECCEQHGQVERARALWQLVSTHPAPDQIVRDEALGHLAALPGAEPAPAPALSVDEACALLRNA